MAGKEKLLKVEVSAAEGIVQALEGAGIDMIFGIQGGNMGRLYDALYDHQDSIRAVLVRHEQLASVMAEVYGRLTGRPGVCTGQGIFMLANGFLGTLEAHFGSSPMLFLSELSDVAPFTLHAPYQSGTGDYGAADTNQALSAITKQTIVANRPGEAVQATQLAIKHALSGDRGPVGVLYHSDCFTSGNIDPQARPFIYPTAHYLPAPQPGDPASVAAAGVQAGGRGDGDDLAAVPALQVRRHRHAGVHRGFDVAVEHPVEHLLGTVGRGAGVHQVFDAVGAGARVAFIGEGDGAAAGVADGDVEAAEFGRDGSDGAFGGAPVGEVGFDAQRSNAAGLKFGDNAVGGHQFTLELIDLGCLQVAVDDRDVGAEAGQPQGIAAAKTARRAGDQCHLAVEFPLAHGVFLLVWRDESNAQAPPGQALCRAAIATRQPARSSALTKSTHSRILTVTNLIR
jgi:hypothetical protein